ncbi:hypothetical protein PHLCEN_2v602 [Hermanssonia centrifuga]|uniref:Seipin n=1 Tax=Hermanssonia centrifuga TaxID=98765 RepID=A0A2R6S5P3_9APHY|nr:hypothetical protein PHLCEN_2v602 [Hermanssonia centrifuga]
MSSATVTKQDEKVSIGDNNNEQAFTSYPWVVRYPLAGFTNLFALGLKLFRPVAPQLVPLAVFVLTIPILVFFSISAGWFVWRSIAVGWETSLYLQYGDGVPPYAQLNLPPLVNQQPYDVSLHLVVPASQPNYELGNFMITLTLLTPLNKTIVSTRRPALVLPPSMSPLSYLIGRSGTVELHIPLLYNIDVGTRNAVARVELGRKDQWRTLGSGEGRELSVLSAFLRGVVVHNGLRGLFTRFPLVTSVIASGTFLFISFVVLASCLLPMIQWRFPEDTQSTDTELHEKPSRRPKRELDESAPAPRKTRSRSLAAPRRTSSQQAFRTEDDTAAMPSSSSTPLRRRRSRMSQQSDPDT